MILIFIEYGIISYFIKNYNNNNPLKVEIKSIIGDGNCLQRTISHFIKVTEYMLKDIRNNIC